MSHFRISNPRVLTAFALEGLLIFGVLYALGVLTLAVTPELGSGVPVAGVVFLDAVMFAICLFATRRTWLGDGAGMRREFILVSVVCLIFAAVAFVTPILIDAGGRLRLHSVLMLEGALVVPISVMALRWARVRWAFLDGSRERILVVGIGGPAQQLCRWLTRHESKDYVVVGFAAEDPDEVGRILSMGVRVTADYDTLSQFGMLHADRVIVALEEKRGKLPLEPLMQLRLNGVAIEEATTFTERTSGKIAVETLLPSWLIFSDGFRTSMVRAWIKRLIDLVLSMVHIVVAAPLMILTAIVIKLESPGPMLYRQKRVGRNGREFDLLKFRSMGDNAERLSGPTWASEDDPRVTRIGRFIRKFRIDELPQLFNVLRGHMSFVGPRPERRHFVQDLEQQIPYYGLRMTVRPGITGWAQVQYPYGASVEDAREKLKYDLYYIKNGDALFDLWIVLKTIRVVLLQRGSR